jgi:hypothetical protein
LVDRFSAHAGEHTMADQARHDRGYSQFFDPTTSRLSAAREASPPLAFANARTAPCPAVNAISICQ